MGIDPLTCDFWELVSFYDEQGRDILTEGCDCGATPEMQHGLACTVHGIFGDLVRDSYWHGIPEWPLGGRLWYDLQWICRPYVEIETYHRGGEINGPRHWCHLTGRMEGE